MCGRAFYLDEIKCYGKRFTQKSRGPARIIVAHQHSLKWVLVDDTYKRLNMNSGLIKGQRILVRAFANEILERIVWEEVKTYVAVCRPEVYEDIKTSTDCQNQ